LEIQIDALAVIPALAVVVNARTERKVLAIWNADRMRDG
jgi:hypothetical protein